LVLEEAEDGGRERDVETKDPQKGRISCGKD
jgi:hypothetical protein